ncbi:MAG: type II secretion system F family protein [Candidatus Gottesmanbacteria bacterium]|nr:type II secretion system F family protein [Candidatus Gottesmanbacteria bacterium]
MAFFTYKARDKDGEVADGTVESPSADSAVKLLRSRELFVVSIKETHAQSGVSDILAKFKKVGYGDVVAFTRQLATMIVAGLSLPDALTILRSQTTNPAFVRLIADVEVQITGGGNLGDSLAKYPEAFSPIYIALVRAGESSGTLDKVLARLADTLESQAEFRSKVKGAMVYPVIIMIGMVAVVMVMMTVVVPKLTDLYKDFGIDLPTPTKILISLSTFFVHFWWLMIAIMVGLSIAYGKWKKTPIGELMVDSITLKLPLFGDLTKKVLLVEFTRTLAMLISAGIHILQGLQTLRDSLGNVRFRNAIDEISKKVEKGFPLGDTFAQYDVFPPIVSQMMKVGEETGKLDDTLVKLSRYFESESEHLVRGLTTAIEPIIMIVLGVGVGFIVISVITPIYNLTAQFK